MKPFVSPLALASRVLLGCAALVSGVHQLRFLPGTAAYLKDTARIPFASTGLAAGLAGLELVCAVAVLAGWRTRAAAAALAGYYGFVAFAMQFGVAHRALDAVQRDQELAQGIRSLAIAGGFLALCALGPGAHSVDRT